MHKLHVDKLHPLVTFHFISSMCIYCMGSCEHSCLMSTELSPVVFVATCNLGSEGKDGLCGSGTIPWRRMYSLNDISSAESLLGPTATPDSQTWASSCEPSVRRVRSQRAGCALITAALSTHRFPLSPLDHTHACQPPVCRSHWSPHSRLSAVVWFCLCRFKSAISSGANQHSPVGQLCHPDAACL